MHFDENYRTSSNAKAHKGREYFHHLYVTNVHGVRRIIKNTCFEIKLGG